MIYYINENSRNNDNIFDCIIESSSIISDIRLLPYETDLFVNESVKDKVVGFFKKIIQKVRDFFRKVKTFLQKSAIHSKIESLKTKIKLYIASNIIKNIPLDTFELSNPDYLDYEKTIIEIKKIFHEHLQEIMDKHSKRLQNIEIDDTFDHDDYERMKRDFTVFPSVNIKHNIKNIKLHTINSLLTYCDNVEDHIKSMYSAMDKLERDMISEINSVQQVCSQDSNLNLNYMSALISSALSGIQRFSTIYYKNYDNMIDTAKKIYYEFNIIG